MSSTAFQRSSLTPAHPNRPGHEWSDKLSELLNWQPGSSGNQPVFAHRTVKPGQRLIRGGQDFESLYLINAGWFKSVHVDEFGNEQTMGFATRGDLLGADGIGSGYYLNEAVSLGVANVIVIPFASHVDFSRLMPGLETMLLQMISRQMVNDQMAAMAISTLTAPARLARFLLNQGERMEQLGCSGSEFELVMGRQDIASYLGMTIETVSRALTRFGSQGMLKVTQRHIEILDFAALRTLAGAGAPPRQASSDVKRQVVNPVPEASGLSVKKLTAVAKQSVR
ncbi:MAG: Crp/Fnr family transcriptional regulator [Burkholderiaceae bacterium]